MEVHQDSKSKYKSMGEGRMTKLKRLRDGYKYLRKQREHKVWSSEKGLFFASMSAGCRII